MRNDQNDKRRASTEESLSTMLTFLDDDPANMSEAELDAYITEAGLDFKAFNDQLTSAMDLGIKKARLGAARSGRATFLESAGRFVDATAMTLEEKRVEIQQRLGLLSENAAAVYNRNYENAEDEEDVDALLADLRSLDERTDQKDDGA